MWGWHRLTCDFYPNAFKPKNQILGCDYSGVVEATGENISEYSIGDEVYGSLDERTGTHAEYIAVSTKEVSRKPRNLSYEEAASIGVAGTMALIALRDHARIQPGQKVLVNGASGGIGTFAVKLAVLVSVLGGFSPALTDAFKQR